MSIDCATGVKAVERVVEMLRRDVRFLTSGLSKQRSPTCTETVSCSNRGQGGAGVSTFTETLSCSTRGHGGAGGKSRKRTFSEFERGSSQSARRSPTEAGGEMCEVGVAEEVEMLRRDVQFLAMEMLKQRCTICAGEEVNRCRSGEDLGFRELTGREDRDWAITEFEDEQGSHSRPAMDGECETRDRTAEMEVELLRRNVKFLACCYPTDPMKITQDDMVCLIIRDADQIMAHRSVLAGVSPVFEKMFSVGMLEKETRKVSISDASLSTMEAVLKYCYTADVSFTAELDLDEVIHIAHKYEINSLTDRCEGELCTRLRDSMKTTVDLSAALGMTEKVLATAEIYGLERLRAACVKELHLRNYIVRQNPEVETKTVRVNESHSRSCLAEDRPSPHALAKLMRLSFKFGPVDMQDGIYRLVQNLSHQKRKQVWTEVMKL